MDAEPGMEANRSYSVLVVEDEPDIAAVVAYHLTREGFGVRTAADGTQALRSVELDPPDLVILDLMLPGMSGVEVLAALRAEDETRTLPVLVLTAKSEEEERIRGLELGADDYVTKPFSPRELVLRVQAVLRRVATLSGNSEKIRRLRSGPIVLDVNAHRVIVDGSDVKLSRKEFRLLQVLMQRQGRTQSRKALLEAVWNTTADIETRTVDMHVRRLRSKLGSHADMIETVRGFGYRFQGAVET